MRAASTAASTIDMPCCAQVLGELDDQDRVLGREADQHDEPDLTEHVVREAAQELRAERAEHRQRHAQQDDERQHPALVLRGEHQVHEQDAQREEVASPSIRPGSPRATGPPRRSRSPGGSVSARHLLHGLDRLARAHARHGDAGDLRRRGTC